MTDEELEKKMYNIVYENEYVLFLLKGCSGDEEE